jgi:hypothetical protein
MKKSACIILSDSLHFARNGMSAAALNNKIYAAGGSGATGGPPPGKPGEKAPSVQPGNMPLPGLGTERQAPAQQDKNHPVDVEVFNLK